jgi:hypothetical protein
MSSNKEKLKIHIIVPPVYSYHEEVAKIKQNLVNLNLKATLYVTQSMYTNVEESKPDVILFHIPKNGNWQQSAFGYQLNDIPITEFEEIDYGYANNIPIYYTYPNARYYYKFVVIHKGRIHVKKIEEYEFRGDLSRCLVKSRMDVFESPISYNINPFDNQSIWIDPMKDTFEFNDLMALLIV